MNQIEMSLKRTLLCGVLLCGVGVSMSSAAVLGIRLGAGTIESYSLVPGTGVATSLDSYAFTGGWSDGMFAADPSSDEFYTASTTPNLYAATITSGALQTTQGITGATRIDAMHALEDDTLFGIRLGAASIESYSLNKATGVASPLDTYAIVGGWSDGMFAVDESAGEFYVATTSLNLYTANLADGSLQSTVSITGATRIDAMHALSDGTLLGIRLGIGTIESYSVNKTTGVATALGSFGISGSWSDGMFAVDEAAGEFYIATTNPNIYTANLTTGALLNTQAITGATRLDAIIVPEPAEYGMMIGIALAGFIVFRHRRVNGR